jgi:hypothetical protein
MAAKTSVRTWWNCILSLICGIIDGDFDVDIGIGIVKWGKRALYSLSSRRL